MHGLSPVPEPPREEERQPGENQFSLAQLLSLMIGVCVLSALLNFALDQSRPSSTSLWMALVGWIGMVGALSVTRLIRTAAQFVLAAVMGVLIAVMALAL